MNRSKTMARVVGVSIAGLVLVACRAQVLTLSEGQNDGGGEAGAAVLGPPPPGSISALSDSEAADLCSWLIQEFPDPSKIVPPPDSPEQGSIAPGYVSGQMIGCGAIGNGNPIGWVYLDVRECVLNLRHTQCNASVASLKKCTAVFVADYPNGNLCMDALSACGDYVAHTECDETVIHSSPEPAGWIDFCTGCLPMRSGVTCPAPGQ